MTLPDLYCPEPPGWRVQWSDLTERFEWLRAMRDCPQDAVFHAEGDVWTHVEMVLEALAADGEFRGLSPFDRYIVFAAALLHDVAKPACTRVEDGRLTSRGHSHRGAIAARRILWELNLDFASREQICALVRFHQWPFYLIDRPDAQRAAFTISQSARCDLLAILARADATGRKCDDQAEIAHSSCPISRVLFGARLSNRPPGIPDTAQPLCLLSQTRSRSRLLRS